MKIDVSLFDLNGIRTLLTRHKKNVNMFNHCSGDKLATGGSMPITKILLEELPHGESRPGEKWRCVLNDDQALSATGEEISLALDEAISAHAKAVGVELEIKHRE